MPLPVSSCETLNRVPSALIERTPFRTREAFTAFVEANQTRIAGLQLSVDGAIRDRVLAARDCVEKKHPAARSAMPVEVEFNLQATPSSIHLSGGVVTTPAGGTIPRVDLDECLRPVLQPLQIQESGDLYFHYTGPYPYKLTI